MGKHYGLSKHPLYRIFMGMKVRCTDSKRDNYKHYGGRGIKVIRTNFQEFFDDMSPSYMPGLTIERIDNDGNYSKENCRWATTKEQANNKRSNLKIPYEDSIYNLGELADKLGIKRTTLSQRFKTHNQVEKPERYSVRRERERLKALYKR